MYPTDHPKGRGSVDTMRHKAMQSLIDSSKGLCGQCSSIEIQSQAADMIHSDRLWYHACAVACHSS